MIIVVMVMLHQVRFKSLMYTSLLNPQKFMRDIRLSVLYKQGSRLLKLNILSKVTAKMVEPVFNPDSVAAQF